MKKTFFARWLLIASALVLSLSISIFAYAPEVRDIDANVVLHSDGSASVTQVWDVTVASGTEWYLVQNNMGDMEISNLSVTDENGVTFQDATPWDVDGSIEEKAGKSGISATGGGYELCWGVGSMGEHKYTVSYTMTNFLKGYSDFDGFNVRLVNDELSSAPLHTKVTISSETGPFTEDTGIWAFGFAGTIYLEDGKIVAESSENLSPSSHITIMAQFPKGVFTPSSTRSTEFAEVREEALAGSDYDPSNDDISHGSYVPHEQTLWDRFLNFVSNPLFLSIFVFFIIGLCNVKFKKTNRDTSYRVNEKTLDYCREIPFDGDIVQTYSALKMAGKSSDDNTLIGAFLLRWIKGGNVRIEERESRGFLGMGKKMEASVVLVSRPAVGGNTAGELYDMLLEASGGDGILQSNELQNWCKSNYSQLDGWLESADGAGSRALNASGIIADIKSKVFFGLIPVTRTSFTEKGTETMNKVLGFKKYLHEFTIINERKPVEVQLWDDYLVYANVFGIAEQVTKDFNDLYPTYFEPQTGVGNYYNSYFTVMLIHDMTRAANAGVRAGHSESTTRSAGGGGFSSFGGGGGFSGGGSGGGSR